MEKIKNMFLKQTLSFMVVFVIAILLACKGTKSDSVTPEVKPAVTAAPVVKKTPIDIIKEKKTLVEAIDYAKIFSEDTENDISQGAVLFTLWAKDNLNRKEFATIPTTTHALVMKDSDSERGKRLCVSGSVSQISKSNSESWEGKKVWEGTMMLPSFKFVKYVAVGETGEIVQGTTATFCGVVIGKHAFSNAVGGTTHSVFAVGEFVSYER